MGYTIYYNPDTQDVIPEIDYDTSGDFSDMENIYVDDKELLGKRYIPIRPKARNGTAWRWRWGMETLIERKNELRFRQNRNGDWVVEFGQSGFNAPRDYQEFGTGTTGLKKIFGGKEVFTRPKSTEFIKWVLEVGANKSATVLDFMAGSGTTGHAVLDLNKEDGGNRKFILCTNNENKICEEVTYPRISKVINGYKNLKKETVKGLGGNLKYFKTDFVKNTNNRDQLKINLTKKCTEILCVKENIFNLKKDQENYKIFTSNDGNRHLCIYYNFIDKDFDNFVKDISKLNGGKAVYIFALNNKIDKKEFKGIPDISFEAIPYKILEVYEQLVKISKK
jgi:uncharacterized protein YbcI